MTILGLVFKENFKKILVANLSVSSNFLMCARQFNKQAGNQIPSHSDKIDA